jgi:hypothetical protein
MGDIERAVVVAPPLDVEVDDKLTDVVVAEPTVGAAVGTEVDEAACCELPLHPAMTNAQSTIAGVGLIHRHPTSGVEGRYLRTARTAHHGAPTASPLLVGILSGRDLVVSEYTSVRTLPHQEMAKAAT